MNDYENLILDYYQLSTPYPTEWPSEKDLSDHSDDESDQNLRDGQIPKIKPRYSALIKVTGNLKSYTLDSQSADSGRENLLQRDEPDPLGTTDSIVTKLKNMGLPVLDDIRLRNKFLISSTTFSPSLFLSQVHSTTSTEELLHGLNVLSQSIDQKSVSLKALVESNFECFVRCKATIDNVYKEMKYHGDEPFPPPSSRPLTHSRHASKNSFRTSNISQSSPATQPSDNKKNCALIKESEYGVLGIKSNLLDVSAKAEKLWGPALGGYDKESNLSLMVTSIEQFKEQYQVCGSISDSIKRKDYEAIVEDYKKAKRFANDVKILVESLGTKTPTDLQIFQILLAVYVWSDVEEMVEDLKADLWRKLTTSHINTFHKNGSTSSLNDQYMDLIETLLELGVTENPTCVWLRSRFNHLKNKIFSTSERSKIEIEIIRRRLANSDKPTTLMVVLNFRSLERLSAESKPSSVDSPAVIELWEKINSFMCDLLSIHGILGEVIEFWQTVQSLIEGRAKRIFSSDPNPNSSQFLRLSHEEALELQNGAQELVDMIRDHVFDFFLNPPVEDISCLFSPVPTTPLKSSSSTQSNMTLSAFTDSRSKYHLESVPPLLKRGEAWENSAFWPPWSNSVSGVHYLGQFLVYIGSAANEMAAMFSGTQENDISYENLKSFVSGIRECCVTAICSAWDKDAVEINLLEDWRRLPDSNDLTKIPMYFGAFGSAILSGVQKILYISEAMAKSDSVNVITPPSAKLLQMVRSQFVSTLYKSLAGLVENAEKPVQKFDNDWMPELDILASPSPIFISSCFGIDTVNSSDRNVRMLLTLNNLQALQVDIIPNIITQFENAFSVKLTDESKTIREVLGQIDTRLFSSFIQPFVDSLRDIIHSGITSPSWVPLDKPQEVGSYVYKTLLSLVILHCQVSTTIPSLTNKVLSYLLEQISLELYETLKLRNSWTLSALMQATLDVEFISQTLSQYTTDKASEIQSRIYKDLDKGTDNNTRKELQNELPEMRAALKWLRDKAFSPVLPHISYCKVISRC